MTEDKFADIRKVAISRLMRWPFNRSREEAEKAADNEVAALQGASDRFGKMLERIDKKKD